MKKSEEKLEHVGTITQKLLKKIKARAEKNQAKKDQPKKKGGGK